MTSRHNFARIYKDAGLIHVNANHKSRELAWDAVHKIGKGIVEIKRIDDTTFTLKPCTGHDEQDVLNVGALALIIAKFNNFWIVWQNIDELQALISNEVVFGEKIDFHYNQHDIDDLLSPYFLEQSQINLNAKMDTVFRQHDTEKLLQIIEEISVRRQYLEFCPTYRLRLLTEDKQAQRLGRIDEIIYQLREKYLREMTVINLKIKTITEDAKWQVERGLETIATHPPSNSKHYDLLLNKILDQAIYNIKLKYDEFGEWEKIFELQREANRLTPATA